MHDLRVHAMAWHECYIRFFNVRFSIDSTRSLTFQKFCKKIHFEEKIVAQ